MASRSPFVRALVPRFWGAHLLMVVVVVVTVWLGGWQWTISERAKQARIDDLTHAEPVPLAEAMGPNDAFPGPYLGRSALVEGRWLPEGTVLVEGQEHDGREGYWVATPVVVGGTQSAIYVVRGWTASADDAPAPPTGETRLVGWLQPPQQDRLTDEDPADDVVPQLDVTALMDHVDVDLYSGFVVDATAEDAWAQAYETTNVGGDELAPVAAPTPPEPDGSEGLRNQLYAVQWWLFTVFALYIWVRYLIDALRPVEEPPAENDTQETTVISGS